MWDTGTPSTDIHGRDLHCSGVLSDTQIPKLVFSRSKWIDFFSLYIETTPQVERNQKSKELVT